MSVPSGNQRTHSIIEKVDPTLDQHSYSSYFVVVEKAGNHATVLALERIKKYYKNMKLVAEMEDKRFRALSKIVPSSAKQTSTSSDSVRPANSLSYQDFVEDSSKILVAEINKSEEHLKNLDTHLKAVKDLMETYEALRKQMSSDIDKCKVKLNAKINNLDSKRRIYHKKYMDHQQALKIFNILDQDVNATKKSVEDAKQVEVEKCKYMEDSKAVYMKAIQDFNTEQNDVIHPEITGTLSQIQTHYASLLMSFKEETIRFIDLYHLHLQSLSTCNCEKKEIATKINPERDMQIVIQETECNSLKLPDQIFIDYSTVVGLKSNPDIKNKPKTAPPQSITLSASSSSVDNPSTEPSKDVQASAGDASKKTIKPSMFKNLFSLTKSPSTSPTIAEEKPSKTGKMNKVNKAKEEKTPSPSQSKNPFDNLQFDPNDTPENLLQMLQKMDEFLIVKAKEIKALDKMGDANMSEASLSLANKMRDNFKIYREAFQKVYDAYLSVSKQPYDVRYTLVNAEFHFSDDEDPVDENSDSNVCSFDTQEELPPNTKKCIALYDFTGTEPDDLSIVQGEELIFVSYYDDSWSKVQRTQGSDESGLVPTSYIRIS